MNQRVVENVERPGTIARWWWESICWLQRCHPRMPGRWRLARLVQARQALLAGLPAGVRDLAPGCRLYIDPGDYDGLNYLLYGINHAEPVTRLLLALIQPGDKVLDVGANVGFFSVLASKLVGPTGAVVAFEASPVTFARLAAARTPHRNISAVHCAVSDRLGELEFSLGPPGHSGMASLRVLDAADRRVRVQAITLDSRLAELPKTALVKIDVEGAECMALRGMVGLLARDRPVVVLELTPRFLASFGHAPQDIIELMGRHGYLARRVIDRQPFTGLGETEFQCDLVFVPQERDRWLLDATEPGPRRP